MRLPNVELEHIRKEVVPYLRPDTIDVDVYRAGYTLDKKKKQITIKPVQSGLAIDHFRRIKSIIKGCSNRQQMIIELKKYCDKYKMPVKNCTEQL